MTTLATIILTIASCYFFIGFYMAFLIKRKQKTLFLVDLYLIFLWPYILWIAK